jgi:hypothetical protein
MAPPRAIASLACVAGVLFITACTSSAPPTPSPTSPPPAGTFLSVTTDQSATSLVRYRPADASSETIDSPINPEAVNRSKVTGVTTADGALVIAANTDSLQVYAVPAAGAQVESLGPPLDVRAEDEPSVQISEAGAVVATCRDAFVLPLPDADGWIRVASSCWGALDPTGSRVAVVAAGGHVVAGDLGSNANGSLLFELSDLSASLGTDAPPRLVGTPSWGPEGLAFFVRAGDQLGVFIREEESGDLVEVLQERYTNVYRVPQLAWQPNGTVLAISDDVGPYPAVLRVFDTATGELRALSMFPVGYAGIQWAPDGTAVAVLTGTGVVLVVDLNGDWLLRRETDWKQLVAWDAAR